MSFRVLNSDIEGQHALQSVTPVILLKSRVLLSVILSLLTCFIFALALKWHKTLYNTFLFEACAHESVATHFRVESNGQQFICRKRFLRAQAYFEFRMLKYFFGEKSQAYEPAEFRCEDLTVEHILRDKDTLSHAEKLERFGPCVLKIPIDPFYVHLFDGLTGPFNFLQYFATIIWLYGGQRTFPILILAFTILGVLVNYLLYVKARRNLQQLALVDQKVAMENGEQQDGSGLLPGDIIQLKDGQALNCDCLIISGDVMVNEATLTGEGIPIPKSLCPDQTVPFVFEKMGQHMLYDGTKIIKANNAKKNLGLVLRTGYSTLKGQYFRNVLFPAPPSKRFYIQAAKFIIEFAIVIAIIYLGCLAVYIPMNIKASLLVLRFLDNIVWSIPPSMPIIFIICKIASLGRLASHGITSSNADKIEFAGNIDTCCFDKTGTLTQLQLQAKEIWTKSEEQKPYAIQCLACCHHLMLIGNELAGDPLEVEMFNYLGWKITFEGKPNFSVQDENNFFEIEKIFDFSSARQMMSVVANNGTQHFLFAKGSPEMINQQAIQKQPEIIKRVEELALEGYRILGLGYRSISKEQANLSREELEQQLNFIGLFVLENQLKSDSKAVIDELKESGYDIKVISGDNPLTTIHCAKSAGIIPEDKETLILDYNRSERLVTTQKVGDQCMPLKQIDELENIITSDSSTVITGAMLEYLSKFYQNDQMQASPLVTNNQVYTECNQIEIDDGKLNQYLIRLIKKSRVFARQKPEQKKQIVALLQDQKRLVMMCGDGANDCSAIAQAQIGISFSESDASYTAPFSSKNTSTHCCIKVLAQGKATKMSIIEIFQFQISSNGIKFGAILFSFMQFETFADFQFTYVGAITNIPLLIFLCFSAPLDKLAPFTPLDDQFAYQNQIKIYNNIVFGFVGLIINWFVAQGAGLEPIKKEKEDELNKEGVVQSIMFLSICYYFMTFAISIYISKPFKKQYYHNYILAVWTAAWLIVAIVAIIVPRTGKWLKVTNYMDEESQYYTYKGFNWVVLAVVVGTSILGGISQSILQKFLPSMYRIEH